MKRKISDNISLGVSCTGNVQALVMCLTSVLTGTLMPRRIQLRMCGEFPSFSNFYLEQISALANIKGVEFMMFVSPPSGVRDSRDWHVGACSTDFLWMIDDDVVFDCQCLERLSRAISWFIPTSPNFEKFAYAQGIKGDVNNRRGYPDFNLKINSKEELKAGCSFNHFYEWEHDQYLKVQTLDTGNVLLRVPLIKKHNWCFRLFKDSLNSGGEDTLFALQIAQSECEGFLVPDAIGFHLEKPASNFNEFAARGEMILRACDYMGYDKEIVKREFMSWLFSK